MRSLRDLGIFFRAKDHLREAFAIAQVDENDAAMIAPHMHPAGEFDLAADVGFTQFVAMMSAVAHARKCCASFWAKRRIAQERLGRGLRASDPYFFPRSRVAASRSISARFSLRGRK